MEMEANRTMKDPSPSGTRDGHVKKSNKGSKRKRSGSDLFSPRPFIGRNDIVVELNLGKVIIPKEEMEVGIIKKEKITDDEMEEDSDPVQVDVDEDKEHHRVFEDQLDSPQEKDLDTPETSPPLPCTCACWSEVTSLKVLVEAQGVQIQNLNRVIVGLLGKQMELESSLVTNKPPQETENKNVSFPPHQESLSTQFGERVPDVVTGGSDTGSGAAEKTSAKEDPVPEAEGDLHIAHHGITVGQVVPPSTRPPPQPEWSSSKMNGSGDNSCTSLVSTPPIPLSPHQGAADQSRRMTDGGGLQKPRRKGNGAPSAEGNFTCSHCSSEGGQVAWFASLSTLHRHVREKHRPKKRQHKCDQCGKMFIRKEALDQHLKHVHQGIRYQCNFCTASYSKRYYLAQHEKLHVEGVPLIRCNLCGVDVISETTLSQHHTKYHDGRGSTGKPRKMKTSGQEKARPPAKKKVRVPHGCPHCEMRFDCNASLRYHLHKMHGILERAPEKK